MFLIIKIIKTKELLLKKYLQKWQEKNDIITNKENVSDTILPNAFRLHKAKTFTKNNFVNKIMTIKYGAKYALDNLKNKGDEQKLIKFNTLLKEKKLQTLKIYFRIIKIMHLIINY